MTEEFQDLPSDFVQKNADKGTVFSLQPLHVIMDSTPYTKIIPYFSEEKVSFTEEINNYWYGYMHSDKTMNMSQIKGYGGLHFSFHKGDEFFVKLYSEDFEKDFDTKIVVGDTNFVKIGDDDFWLKIKIAEGGIMTCDINDHGYWSDWSFKECHQTIKSDRQVNYTNISVNKEFLLDKITALGITEDNEITNVELKTTNTKMTPWKIFPSDITGKLDLFMDWQDGSSVIPWDTAKHFISSDGDGVLLYDEHRTDNVITKPVSELLSNMILLTYGFISNFSNIPRNTQGAFNPKDKIGYGNKPINMSAISGQSAVSIIAGLLDKFTLRFPSEMEGDKGNVVRSLISALSRYIISPASISGGNNRFNEIFLPWFFEIKSGIDITDPPSTSTDTGTTYTLTEPLKIELKSRYYDFSIVNNEKVISDKEKRHTIIKSRCYSNRL